MRRGWGSKAPLDSRVVPVAKGAPLLDSNGAPKPCGFKDPTSIFILMTSTSFSAQSDESSRHPAVSRVTTTPEIDQQLRKISTRQVSATTVGERESLLESTLTALDEYSGYLRRLLVVERSALVGVIAGFVAGIVGTLSGLLRALAPLVGIGIAGALTIASAIIAYLAYREYRRSQRVLFLKDLLQSELDITVRSAGPPTAEWSHDP